MSGLVSRRRADLALVAAWARAVWDDSTFRGRVHRTDAGWLRGERRQANARKLSD